MKSIDLTYGNYHYHLNLIDVDWHEGLYINMHIHRALREFHGNNHRIFDENAQLKALLSEAVYRHPDLRNLVSRLINVG